MYSFYPYFFSPYGCHCSFTPKFSVAVPIAETLVQMKYISELVTDLPIVSTFRACDPNVRGTPPISSILFALGVLDGDGLYVPLLWNKVFVFNNNNNNNNNKRI